MPKRHCPSTQALPRIWLMTDERLGAGLMDAVRALPKGSGIIFRHYATPEPERRALFQSLQAIARRNGHVLLLAGPVRLARYWGADGSHGRHRGAVTAPVHSLREMRAAEHAGAQLLFVSPIFATRSHPGKTGIGTRRLANFVRQANRPVIALGGMTRAQFKTLRQTGVDGWAAIDGLTVGRR
jgi:thiamine-phosphate pyrophosphorylase